MQIQASQVPEQDEGGANPDGLSALNLLRHHKAETAKAAVPSTTGTAPGLQRIFSGQSFAATDDGHDLQSLPVGRGRSSSRAEELKALPTSLGEIFTRGRSSTATSLMAADWQHVEECGSSSGSSSGSDSRSESGSGSGSGSDDDDANAPDWAEIEKIGKAMEREKAKERQRKVSADFPKLGGGGGGGGGRDGGDRGGGFSGSGGTASPTHIEGDMMKRTGSFMQRKFGGQSRGDEVGTTGGGQLNDDSQGRVSSFAALIQDGGRKEKQQEEGSASPPFNYALALQGKAPASPRRDAGGSSPPSPRESRGAGKDGKGNTGKGGGGGSGKGQGKKRKGGKGNKAKGQKGKGRTTPASPRR
jgi:hypothetical protein